MLNQNCFRSNVLGSLSQSRGFAQTVKLFAMGIVCSVSFVVSTQTLLAQVIGMDRYGEGTIVEFKRFVNGEETKWFDPGDTIWATAKATYVNNEEDEQDVTFTLLVNIHIEPPQHTVPPVAKDAETAEEVEFGGAGELNVDTRKKRGEGEGEEGGYITPVNGCPNAYRAGFFLISAKFEIVGEGLDAAILYFQKR